MAKKGNRSRLKFVVLIFLILLSAAALFYTWDYIFKSNTHLEGKNFYYLKIPKNTDYDGLKKIITSSGVIKDIKSFEWYAQKMNLEKNIHAGRYRINAGMSNRQIVKMIKNGNEERVEISINYTTRTKQHLVEKLTSKFNVNKERLIEFLNDEGSIERNYGLNKNTLMLLVRPGKYSLSWSIDEKDFFDLMKKEFDQFWTADKLKKLKNTGLSREEAMIMASIIEWESNIPTEQCKIAGVYLNRIKKNMLLQADPTVIFALNDFTIKRVSFADLKYDSPFNTYKYKGLPPGPIGFPQDKSILSVLNYYPSEYLFFCAKPELNGYSNFSKTIEEHEAFAKAYRLSLNKRGIHR